MASKVTVDSAGLTVQLSGWDRMMLGRRRQQFPCDMIVSAGTALRSELEPTIGSRILGIGTHDGTRRPGRRRVGVMLGTTGRSFWAVPSGPPHQQLLVLNTNDDDLGSAVLAVDDPEAMAAEIGSVCHG